MRRRKRTRRRRGKRSCIKGQVLYGQRCMQQDTNMNYYTCWKKKYKKNARKKIQEENEEEEEE